MTKEGYKKHKEVIEAWSNGAEIQYRGHSSSFWANTNCPEWYINYEYRIKPKSEIVPFDYSDIDSLLGRYVKNNNVNISSIITAITEKEVLIGEVWFEFNTLLKNFTFLDGSPCGKIKQ